MAVIILVHGTFATGPEEGESWWQGGSVFERELKDLVAADDGSLEVKRFVWDGNNSMTSRRAAGAALLEMLLGLERSQTAYVLVGHSHGGSVIAEALTKAAIAGNPLPHLKRWVTVGTPFIAPEKERFLFSRVGALGKAVLVAITTFTMCAILAILHSFQQTEAIAAAVVTVALLPAFCVYLFLWLFDRRQRGHFRKPVIARFAATFGPRWHGLWHEDDEAINGLAALGNADRSIFAHDFAVPALSMLAIVVFPLLVYALLSSPDVAKALLDFHTHVLGPEKILSLREGGTLKGGGRELGINFVLLLTSGGEAFASVFPGRASTARAIFLLGIVPLTFLLLAAIVLGLVTLAARPVSARLSRLFNAATWAQFRREGFGGDVQGERETSADAAPKGFAYRFEPLPPDIAAQIASISDAAAGKAIANLRGAINRLAFAKGESQRDALADYLTWQELIHTSYFEVPAMRKLVAFTITECAPFRATSAFAADGDFARVGAWHRTLVAASAPTPQAKSKTRDHPRAAAPDAAAV
ncbi:MAG: hypothetical protein NW223_06290 [Hyphomicrobiaceae bacterium]|nr:hypothetical protein [Hyphomicrobiaceae bacterium]